VSQEPTNRTFDDLARAMAEGSISRRGALKLLAGTAIAALIPSRALAGDDDCVRVCHVPFDRETEECDFDNARTRCVSRRERRRHLENHPCDCRGRCANCLSPGCPPDTEICGDSCCTADESCWTDFITQDSICCSNDPLCVGDRSVGGQQACFPPATSEDCARPTCNSDAECSSGELCVLRLCDPLGNRCMPIC
jgi:hypothetical protein